MIRPQLAELMKRMDKKSVAIIPSAREATRSNDTQYRYRQDSDFLYLTGFEEPESIAIVAPDREQKYVLFVRPRDPEREIWDGKRFGVDGAKSEFGAHEAYPIAEFDAKLTEILDGAGILYYRLGVRPDLDEKIIREIARMRSLNRKPIHPPRTIVDPATIIHEMRVIKSDAEIEVMQHAADIAAEAHVEAMKTVRPGMKEFEVEALLEHFFRRHGASGPAYTSIIGSGANATVLHYISNDGDLRDGDLLLIDAGAEYRGYASDITRTFPINGRFTKAQREIYDLVLETQKACVEMVRPGTTHDELKSHSIELMTEGMVRLGLLQGDPKELIKEKKHEKFYMHGLGHMLGIDVHDVGVYYYDKQSRELEPGVVMTVEPGLYIAPDTKDARTIPQSVCASRTTCCAPATARAYQVKVPKDADEINS